MKPIFFEREGWFIYPNTIIGMFLSGWAFICNYYIFILSYYYAWQWKKLLLIPGTLLIWTGWYIVAYILSIKREVPTHNTPSTRTIFSLVFAACEIIVFLAINSLPSCSLPETLILFIPVTVLILLAWHALAFIVSKYNMP
jgi:hypothetical protein